MPDHVAGKRAHTSTTPLRIADNSDYEVDNADAPQELPRRELDHRQLNGPAPIGVREGNPALNGKALAVGFIRCLLVIMLGSLAVPQFFFLEQTLEVPEFSMPSSITRAGAVRRGAGFGVSLGFQSPDSCFLAAETSDFRVLALPSFNVQLDHEFITHVGRHGGVLRSWDQVRNSASAFACGVAHSFVASMASRVWSGYDPPRFLHAAPLRREASFTQWDPNILANARQWEDMTALIEQTERTLVAALRAVRASDRHHEYLMSSAERVMSAERPQFRDVPTQLRRFGDPVHHRHLASLPFSNRFTPTTTSRIVQAEQLRDTEYRPMSYADILSASALEAMFEWLKIEASNMAAIRKHGPQVRRVRGAFPKFGFGEAVDPHGVLVIGQDQFLEPARGIVWDCRPFEYGGVAIPMEFDAVPNLQIDPVTVARELADWPDQELVGFLLDGVQFKADLPLQIVLGPHLQSLSQAYGNVEKEILRLWGEGLYERHNVLPYLPIRAVPQGSVPRKLEPGRDRRTSDGGLPRQRVVDDMGIPAVSLNQAIGLKDSFPWDDDLGETSSPAINGISSFWRRWKWDAWEVKPQIQDKAWDDLILRYAAYAIFHEPILGWTDDVADYFNHFALAPSEYWVSCMFWLFEDSIHLNWRAGEVRSEGPVASVISEHRLGFGVSASPNIAQRFAWALVGVWKRRFDAEETALFNRLLDPITRQCTPYSEIDAQSTAEDGWTDVCRWIAERRRLSALTGRNELRRYSVHMYTDDPCFTVIGIDTLMRAMRVWDSVTSDFNLKMAIAKKRQVGARYKWLGFNFFLPAGLIVPVPEKVSRANEWIALILRGEPIMFDEYRRLVGLLEHLLPLMGGDREWMYGLYEFFAAAVAQGPSTTMRFSPRSLRKLQHWFNVLATSAGCFNSVTLKSRNLPTPVLPEFTRRKNELISSSPVLERAASLYSDAAVEGSSGGIGGWAHGDYWHLMLSAEDCALMHITAWEFVALGINLITFASRLEHRTIYLLSDAMATVQVMQLGAARAPVMQIIHEAILARPEYRRFDGNLLEQHVFGEMNILADAASRGKIEFLKQVASQMGVCAREIALSTHALDFLQHVREPVREFKRFDVGSGAARAQGTDELALMQHRGARFSTAEDQPLQYPVEASGFDFLRPLLHGSPGRGSPVGKRTKVADDGSRVVDTTAFEFLRPSASPRGSGRAALSTCGGVGASSPAATGEIQIAPAEGRSALGSTWAIAHVRSERPTVGNRRWDRAWLRRRLRFRPRHLLLDLLHDSTHSDTTHRVLIFCAPQHHRWTRSAAREWRTMSCSAYRVARVGERPRGVCHGPGGGGVENAKRRNTVPRG